MAHFRVIHPFHPLLGQEFVLVDRRVTWGEDRVYFVDEHEELKRMPASWTSAGARDPFVEIAAGRACFRVEDLFELVSLIARERQSEKDGSRRGAAVECGK